MKEIDYNEISKTYDHFRKEYVEILQHLLSHSGIHSSSTILEFGCGTGNYANMLQHQTDACIYGVDPSEGMIEKAKAKNLNITYTVGDSESLPFPEMTN